MMAESGTAPILREWQRHFEGRLVTPRDENYETARRVWNGMIDRRPAVIARCVSAADVRQAVTLARAEGISVSVRGGGHSVAGTAVCDGGIMIDLSPMKDIRVDPLATMRRRSTAWLRQAGKSRTPASPG
jgi:FAD/FMN-containing dehydrogenase